MGHIYFYFFGVYRYIYLVFLFALFFSLNCGGLRTIIWELYSDFYTVGGLLCNLVVFKIGLLFCTQHSCQYKVNIHVICKRIYFFITVL